MCFLFLAALRSGLFLWEGLNEMNAKLISVRPDQFTAAMGGACRGQDQKELLKAEPSDGTLDRQLRTGLRHILDRTNSGPCAVGRDDLCVNPAGEHDPACFSLVVILHAVSANRFAAAFLRDVGMSRVSK